MRVWLYYRLSRDEDEELNSLRNQRSIIESYALRNGHSIVGESFDDNVSGMHFDREGIEQLCEAVDAGRIDAVIVVRADAGIEADAVDNLLGIQSLHLGIGIQLVEIGDTQRQICIGK